MDSSRKLLIIADDFGIGPETTRGILDLAHRGIVTGSVLLVNSPFAEAAVGAWRHAGQPVGLGWHANLTLDRPILPPDQVPTLVGPDGVFWPLRTFLARLSRGQIASHEIRAEWLAQRQRFVDLVGHPPALVNTHHHVQVFAPIGQVLLSILADQRPLPYVRRVVEPWRTLLTIAGARGKRLLLTTLGRRLAHEQERLGFPGSDVLAGLTAPACLKDPRFIGRWLEATTGAIVEWICHPGHADDTPIGRDDGHLVQARVDEGNLLADPSLPDIIERLGLTLTSPEELLAEPARRLHVV